MFLLQETLLGEETTITLPRYRAFHCLHSQRVGGGLAVLARHSLDCCPIQQPLPYGNGVEVVAITLHLVSFVLWMYNQYRPPTIKLDLNELFGLVATDMVLGAGDLNAHSQQVNSPCPTNAAGHSLYAAYQESGHIHLLNETTSPTHIQQGRLDLTFVSTNLLPVLGWLLHLTLMSDHV